MIDYVIIISLLIGICILFYSNGIGRSTPERNKRELCKLLTTMDRCCERLDRFVTEPDEWIIVRAIACDIMDLVRKVKGMKEVFQRTK